MLKEIKAINKGRLVIHFRVWRGLYLQHSSGIYLKNHVKERVKLVENEL